MDRYVNINILIKMVTFFSMLLFGQVAFSQSDNTLWYKQPAENFEGSMVLGNGLGIKQIYSVNAVTFAHGKLF